MEKKPAFLREEKGQLNSTEHQNHSRGGHTTVSDFKTNLEHMFSRIFYWCLVINNNWTQRKVTWHPVIKWRKRVTWYNLVNQMNKHPKEASRKSNFHTLWIINISEWSYGLLREPWYSWWHPNILSKSLTEVPLCNTFLSLNLL